MKTLSQKTIEAKLASLPLGKIAYYPTIGSTNTLAATWATNNAPDLSLIVADEQTAGRGRSGRVWHTPPNSALALTVILKFPADVAATTIPRVAGLGALAVAEGLAQGFGIKSEIKWPNDVLVNGKKICGVLAEAHWLGNHLQALILGIGINIAPQSIPDKTQLTFPATCVVNETEKTVGRLDVLFHTLECLVHWKTHLFEPTFIETWESKLAFREKQVEVFTNDQKNSLTGKLIGLDEQGQLHLHLNSGEDKWIPAGEIHLRPIVDRD